MKTGLYFQDPKYDISRSRTITDPNLVLYLPLHRLDGASFMSRDAYGHLCTVTGALWTPQGRSFDAVPDDYITVPDHSVFDISAELTVLVWVKCANLAGGETFLSKYNGVGDNREWSLDRFTDTGKVAVYLGDPNDGTYEGSQRTDDAHIIAGEYLLAGFTFNRGTITLSTDGQDIASSVGGGSIPASLYNGTSDVKVGSLGNNSWNLEGNVGEVWMYRRAFMSDRKVMCS